MPCLIEFEKFIENIALPEGIRFKEFGDGCFIAPALGYDGTYVQQVHAALERKDGETSFFSMSFIRTSHKKFMISASQLSEAVDKALLRLETTTNGN